MTRIRAIALAALTALILAGCGSGPSDSAGPSTGAPGFPRTVVGAMGPVTIPNPPSRVAALDNSFVEAAIMLDTRVVARAEDVVGDALPQYVGRSGDYAAGAAGVGTVTAPSVEKVAVARPDLIVSSKARHEALYQQLGAIAPTLFSETTGPTWKDNIRLLAKALGKETLAEERIGHYETQARAVGDAVKTKAGADTTVSVVWFANGPIRLYANKSFSGIVLRDTGLARPASQNVDTFIVQVSPEQITMADATRIFVSTNDKDGPAKLAAMEQNPLWIPLLPKVVKVDDDEWIASVSVQGAYRILADVAKAFDVPGPEIPSWISGK